MKIELNALGNLTKGYESQKKAAEGFEKLLQKEIEAVDQAQKVAEEKLVRLASGQDPDLAGVSLALTKADLSFRLLLQVRNKVLEAYQEIMRMQI